MGRFIKLPGVNPGTDRPKVDLLHPLLPENGGAMYLIEPGAPGSLGWAAGVPSHAAKIKNIAEAQALATIPGSVAAGVQPYFWRGSMQDGAGVVRGAVERTSKGGLHTIVRPGDEYATTDLSNVATSIDFAVGANTIQSWINLHKMDHSWFFTEWFIPTRIPTGGYSEMYDLIGMMASTTAPSGNYIMTPKISGIAGSNLGLASSGELVQGTPRFVAGASSSMKGDSTKTVNELRAFLTGARGGMNSYKGGGSSYGLRGSRAFYLAYLEDLTVSGRTFAQVQAINAAAFAAAFGTGGRYANDTYTNPETWVAA